MASRTINVTEEAYSRLRGLKREGESFSVVINRLTGKYRLLELVGLLSAEQTTDLEGHLAELRQSAGKSFERRVTDMGF